MPPLLIALWLARGILANQGSSANPKWPRASIASMSDMPLVWRNLGTDIREVDRQFVKCVPLVIPRVYAYRLRLCQENKFNANVLTRADIDWR